ncbi:MAG: hypothetical protein KDD45_00710 [Bdellovibrionales bacterium]|nr:hypothetical protein [Bdellovibrionales bacterium]
MNKESVKIYKKSNQSNQKVYLLESLVDELMKENPNQQNIKDLCVSLEIPYSLDASTQIGNVFNKLQSLKAQAINR